MKKLILQIVSFLLVTSVMSQQADIQPVRLEKLSEKLYQILDGRGANGGAYIGDTGVLVIDAKMTKLNVDQTIFEIKKITDKPIKYLVSTHSDGDHITGNRFFPPTVIFIAHENCRKEFFHPRRDDTPSEWDNPELLPFIPSITFRDKMDLYLGAQKVELWYFGVGHTTGDLVVYFPEEKTAFIGDQIFVGRPQLIHSYKNGNSFAHVKTLTKMLNTLDAEHFCSGHSDVIDRQIIKNHIEKMKQKQTKIKTLMDLNKNLEQIKTEFNQNESRLIESIYNEIKSGAM